MAGTNPSGEEAQPVPKGCMPRRLPQPEPPALLCLRTLEALIARSVRRAVGRSRSTSAVRYSRREGRLLGMGDGSAQRAHASALIQ